MKKSKNAKEKISIKKRKIQIELNQDVISEIILFLSPLHVLDLKLVSKSWLNTTKSSNYWKFQYLKYFNDDKNIKDFEKHFKESLISLKTKTLFGYSFDKPIASKTIEKRFQINNRKDLKDGDIRFLFCLEQNVFLIGLKNLFCVEMNKKKIIWQKDFKELFPYAEYSHLNELIICKKSKKLFSLNPKNGNVVWKRRLKERNSGFILKGNMIVFCDKRCIYGIEASSGLEIWKIAHNFDNDIQIPQINGGFKEKIILLYFTSHVKILEFKNYRESPSIRGLNFEEHYGTFDTKLYHNSLLLSASIDGYQEGTDILISYDLKTSKSKILIQDSHSFHYSIDIFKKTIYFASNDQSNKVFRFLDINQEDIKDIDFFIDSKLYSKSKFSISNIIIQENEIYFLVYHKKTFFLCCLAKENFELKYLKKLEILSKGVEYKLIINNQFIIITTGTDFFIFEH